MSGGSEILSAAVETTQAHILALVTPAGLPGAIENLAWRIQRFRPTPFEFENAREGLINKVFDESQSFNTLLRLASRQHLYGKNHDETTTLLGRVKSLRAVTPHQLMKHQRQVWRPERGVLAIVGDISEEELEPLMKQVRKRWGSWRQEVQPLTRDRRSTKAAPPEARPHHFLKPSGNARLRWRTARL